MAKPGRNRSLSLNGKRASLLIAGVGNVFFGDDAFGVEMIRALRSCPLRAEVVLRDFGVRSYDLAQALASGFDGILLIDAYDFSVAPGTLTLLDLSNEKPEGSRDVLANGHSLDIAKALELARSWGPLPKWIRLLGCQPESLDPVAGSQPPLTVSVGASIPAAVGQVNALVEEFFAEAKARRTGP